MPRHELSHGTAEKVLAGYRAGRLVKDIAAELGISDDTIYRMVRAAEQPLRRSAPRMSDAMMTTACELYQQGLSLAKVSAELGVPATTIKRGLLASGVELRPR